MKTLILAAVMFAAATTASFAISQDFVKPSEQTNPNASATPAPPSSESPDARQIATDADVGDARRTYRASCQRYQSAGFCDCLTAGVSQALAPQEVRIAAHGFGSWINSQGPAASAETDATKAGSNSMSRIEQVQGHYADTCQQFRR